MRGAGIQGFDGDRYLEIGLKLAKRNLGWLASDS